MTGVSCGHDSPVQNKYKELLVTVLSSDSSFSLCLTESNISTQHNVNTSERTMSSKILVLIDTLVQVWLQLYTFCYTCMLFVTLVQDAYKCNKTRTTVTIHKCINNILNLSSLGEMKRYSILLYAESDGQQVTITNGEYGPSRPYLPSINPGLRDTFGRSWPGNTLNASGHQYVECWNDKKVGVPETPFQ